MRMGWMRACLLVPLLAAAAGCDRGAHHGGAQQAAAHEAAGGSHALRLNDGERWEMDGHTRTMLRQMTERLERASGAGEAASLGRELDGDLDELVRGCTMTGEAHAELHKFLAALIPAVEKLTANGGDDELAAVRELLDSYPRYFH